MFVRYYVELPMAFIEAERALMRSYRILLQDAVDRGQARQESLLDDVGACIPDRRVGGRVAVEIGEPIRVGSKTMLPMSWWVNEPHALLHNVDADIELAPLGTDATQFAINARYMPSLQAQDCALDRGLVHRLAEATVKTCLDHAARGLLNSMAA